MLDPDRPRIGINGLLDTQREQSVGMGSNGRAAVATGVAVSDD